jgi:hypothetical protein
MMLGFSLFNGRDVNMDCVLSTKGSSHFAIDDFFTKPVIKVFQNCVAFVLILLAEYGYNRIRLHGTLNGMK